MSAIIDFRNKLEDYISRRIPLIWINCFDYRFLYDELNCIFENKLNISSDKVYEWDAIWGGREYESYKHNIEDDVLKVINDFESNKYRILILKDIDRIFEHDKNKEVQIMAYLQNFNYKNLCLSDYTNEKRKTIIMQSSASYATFDVIGKLLYKLDLPLPDKDDIEMELGLDDCVPVDENYNECIRMKAKYFKSKSGYIYDRSFHLNKDRNKKELVEAFCGMHLYNIRQLLRTIIEKNGSINQNPKVNDKNDELPSLIKNEKKQIVRNSGLLDIVDVAKEQKDSVGNIEALEDYINRQKIIIDNIAVYPLQMPRPKGIMLVGAPGCGKSESVKAIAAILDKPLLRLDIGRLMGQYVGQSEHNLADAIKVAEAAAPCILWIDEIEKAFAGFGNSGENNDITVTRMIGSFLTWMQEHKSLVYLVATANNLDNLRPEFLRKGRWDEIFYLNYPDKKGTEDIIKKCMKKYGLSIPEGIDKWAETMSLIPLSGAEIDGLIIEAFQKSWNCNDGSYHIDNNEMIKIINNKKNNKGSSKQDLLDIRIRKSIQEIRVSRDLNSKEEERVKAALTDLYKEKSMIEIEKEYKAKGFISASKK